MSGVCVCVCCCYCTAIVDVLQFYSANALLFTCDASLSVCVCLVFVCVCVVAATAIVDVSQFYSAMRSCSPVTRLCVTLYLCASGVCVAATAIFVIFVIAVLCLSPLCHTHTRSTCCEQSMPHIYTDM